MFLFFLTHQIRKCKPNIFTFHCYFDKYFFIHFRMLISKLVPLLRCQQRLIFQRSTINPNVYIGYIVKRNFADNKTSVSKAEPRSDVSTDVRPMGEKVKEAAKTASYTGVILMGVGITGIIFYFVFRELFSSSSANSIYSAALDRCIEVYYPLSICYLFD